MKCTVAVAAVFAVVQATQLSGQQQPARSPHGDSDFVGDCQVCHTVDGWRPLRPDLTFEHDVTGFALHQSHENADCESCHKELRFDLVQSHDCGECHMDVHRGTLGTSCDDCHEATRFADVGGEEIHALTTFPLDGAHLLLTCETCHTDDDAGAFTTMNPFCVACHEDDYVGAASIDHNSFGFPTTCDQCHSTLGWGGAYFDHTDAANGFTLAGAHARLRCESCHIVPGLAPIYQPTGDQDCYACHRVDYGGEHGGDGFPITCLDCHDQENWDNASFANHDESYFPIFSGRHAGEWDGCDTCHSAGFSTFSCFGCHEHEQGTTDRHHTEVSGYAYDSALCLSCHPNGRKD